MFFRNLKPKPDQAFETTPVHVMLPVHLSSQDAATAFAEPFGRQLAAASLGHVTDAQTRKTPLGVSEGYDLFIALRRTDDETLSDVIRMLEHLGAPKGSTLRLVDGSMSRPFGRAVGMEISVDARPGTHDTRVRRLSRACSEVVGDVAMLQGSVTLQDRISFYFYGVDFETMREGLAERMRNHPLLSGATLRKL